MNADAKNEHFTMTNEAHHTPTNQEKSDPVLVTGATGQQGGAVARALLAMGIPVRALVRNQHSEKARSIEALGASLVLGDLNDSASLLAAATGVRAVFSVQTPDLTNLYSDAEQVHGRNLVEAAKEANVAQFVHTSVSGAGEHHRNAMATATDWQEGQWSKHYWASKAYTEELVRAANFTYWTIIKPATFMENFIPSSMWLATEVDGRFITALASNTRIPMIAVQDIGTTGAAAISDPEKFNKMDIELASDYLTIIEVTKALSDAQGTKIEMLSLPLEQAIEQGLMAELARSQEGMNRFGSPARPEYARALGLTTTDFKTWANKTLRPSI
jgi:uncharacterized protein YbjT (DUF2867 family)